MSVDLELLKLAKRQKAYMKSILVMTNKLFEIQQEITALSIEKLRKIQDVKSSIESDLITNKDVCKLLNISPSTLYRMRIYDGLPFKKIGGRKSVMYCKKDIDAYLKLNK